MARMEFEIGSGGGIRTHNPTVNSLTGLLPFGPLPSLHGPSRTETADPRSLIVPGRPRWSLGI